ncbi:MAG TPA: DUF3352 domain-containing protein [Tepidisphaeraceae bacterium]|nr:DUF3352 domain-containing protein [Tepidisphaeraceae bacterium]
MFKKIAAYPLTVLFTLLLIPAFARAQALADHLPADTTLYIGWSGADASVPGFKGSNFETILNSSNMRAVVDDFLPRALDRAAREDKDVEEAVQVLKTVVGPLSRHPFAFAFVGMEIDPKTGPKPKLVILSQAGNEAAALKAKVDDLLKQAGPAPFPVAAIQSGDVLALVIGYDKPESAIPAAGAASLATDPEFTKTLSQAGKNGALTVYANIDKVLAVVDMGMGMAPPEIKANWEKARDTLGLKGAHHAILTAGFEGKEWATQAFLDAPAPRTGMLAAMMNGPLSKDIFNAIPSTASTAGAGHFNLNGFLETIRTVAGMIEPNSVAEFDQALGQANQAVGFDIRKDLLANLGDEWAFYSDPTVAGNGIVSLTIVNHLKDPAAVEANLTKLEDFANRSIAEEMKKEKDAPTIAVRRLKWGGIEVHYLPLPLVAPSWAITNGNLYFSFYPETTVAAARRTPGKDKSITDSPAFAALMKKLGDHPTSSFQFADLPRLVPETYSSWQVISHATGIGDLFGVPAPLQILPPLPYLMSTLSASGQIEWTDAAGAHVRGITPFPGADVLASDPTSMSAAQVPLMVSILLPALNKVRGEALKAKSASNLKNIAAGAITYANTHNGKYPKDMGELFESSGMTIDVFVNPATNTSAPHNLPPDQARAWVNEHGDYVWGGGGKDSTMGTDDPLAWENPATATQGINILFGDYHVAWYPKSYAMQLIDKAQKPKTP